MDEIWFDDRRVIRLQKSSSRQFGGLATAENVLTGDRHFIDDRLKSLNVAPFDGILATSPDGKRWAWNEDHAHNDRPLRVFAYIPSKGTTQVGDIPVNGPRALFSENVRWWAVFKYKPKSSRIARIVRSPIDHPEDHIDLPLSEGLELSMWEVDHSAISNGGDIVVLTFDQTSSFFRWLTPRNGQWSETRTVPTHAPRLGGSNYAFSPSGRRLAIINSLHHKQTLYMIDAESGKTTVLGQISPGITARTSAEPDLDPVGEASESPLTPYWTLDGKLLYFILGREYWFVRP